MKHRVAAIAACVAVAAAMLPASAGPVNVVTVRNNRFEPETIRVARGETVNWVAANGGHSVTASDGRFTLPGSGTLREGEIVSWTFHENETVSYYCRVHQPAMRGTVIVGEGSPAAPDPAPSVRTVPSTAYATVAAALTGAEPNTTIELLPGEYHYSLSVPVRDVTIRGAGSSPADVVIDGDRARGAGITALADGLRVENLTVREHGIAGISFAGVRGFAASNVHVFDNGSFGISATEATDGKIGNVTVRGARAGIALGRCSDCRVSVERATIERTGVGISVVDGERVQVRTSTLRDNGAGVVVKGDAAAPGRALDVELAGNVLLDNTNAGLARHEDSVGAAIWVAGGSRVRASSNVISGHRYGIAVATLAEPSVGVVVEGNVIGRSSLADLAWDGLGADVCFGENTAESGGAPTADPPFAPATYSCDLAHTAGIPWPLVTARLLTG